MDSGLWGTIVGAFAGVANGGWALRLESKTAAIEERVSGSIKLGDERHEDVKGRLERIEVKLDERHQRLSSIEGKLDTLIERKR